MDEKEVIRGAYEDTLKTVSGKFFGAYMIATSPEAKQEAEAHFIKGVQAARLAWVRALAILPAP